METPELQFCQINTEMTFHLFVQRCGESEHKAIFF